MEQPLSSAVGQDGRRWPEEVGGAKDAGEHVKQEHHPRASSSRLAHPSCRYPTGGLFPLLSFTDLKGGNRNVPATFLTRVGNFDELVWGVSEAPPARPKRLDLPALFGLRRNGLHC